MAAEAFNQAAGEFTLRLPSGWVAERRYAAHLLFERVMGLSLRFAAGEVGWSTLVLPNGRQLHLLDAGFASSDIASFSQEAHLPGAYTILNRALGPVPYGDVGLRTEGDDLWLEADVLSGTFLLATGAEEVALSPHHERHDAHGRLLPEATWAGRLHLIGRPLIHEWAEGLATLLRQLGAPVANRPRSNAILPTHDIDHPRFFTSRLKRLAAAALRPIGLWHRYLKHTPNPFGHTEPYDTFIELMAAAEARSTQAVFFWMGQPRATSFDPSYALHSAYVQRLCRAILSRGHALGLHPSYASADAPLLVTSEYQKLRRAIAPMGGRITWLRPHFLRGSLQYNWRRAAALDIPNCSTGYAHRLGFRSGLCIPYPAFDLRTRRPLPVTEHPLVAMDVAAFTRRPESGHPSPSADELLSAWQQIQHHCQRSGGTFAFDWHNSTVATPAWAPYAVVRQSAYR